MKTSTRRTACRNSKQKRDRVESAAAGVVPAAAVSRQVTYVEIRGKMRADLEACVKRWRDELRASRSQIVLFLEGQVIELHDGTL